MRTLALLILGVAFACQPATAAAASQERGLRLVERNCGVCHAVTAKGTSPMAEAPPFQDLHLRYDVKNLEEALAEGILTGHPAMPEFRFNPREIRDILSYLRTLEPRRPAQGAQKR